MCLAEQKLENSTRQQVKSKQMRSNKLCEFIKKVSEGKKTDEAKMNVNKVRGCWKH